MGNQEEKCCTQNQTGMFAAGVFRASTVRKVEYFGSQADVESHKSFILWGYSQVG